MIGNRILDCVRQAAQWLKRQRFRRNLEAEGLHLVAEATLAESLHALHDAASEPRETEVIAFRRWPLGAPRTLRDEEPVRRTERPGDPQRMGGPAEARSRKPGAWHARTG